MANKSALLLFSGGQDSATCLMWSLRNFDKVATIGFSYGQRHIVELECRLEFLSRFKSLFPRFRQRLLGDFVLDLDFFSELSINALTHNEEIQEESTGLPNTFVPGRNIFFMTAAAAFAYKRRINNLVGGMCQTDFSGYPDCRQDTITSLETTLNKGMEKQIKIHTPLMDCSKADCWRSVEEWGGRELLELVKEYTHSCYKGIRDNLHNWGYGCSDCPACYLRKKGYEEYEASKV